MPNLRTNKQHPREENRQTHPVEAALDLALPLAGHGDGRGPLLELAGAGLPMRGALAVLLPLALVLLHHVELGHGVAADGSRRRRRGREGGGREEAEQTLRPRPLTLTLCCVKICARTRGRYRFPVAWRFVRAGLTRWRLGRAVNSSPARTCSWPRVS